jgi:hypothetical protein
MDVFAGVPHLRIPFGQKFGQMVAMGMLYYRLYDILYPASIQHHVLP